MGILSTSINETAIASFEIDFSGIVGIARQRHPKFCGVIGGTTIDTITVGRTLVTQQVGQRVAVQITRNPVPLHPVVTKLLQVTELRFGLYAFGNNPEAINPR